MIGKGTRYVIRGLAALCMLVGLCFAGPLTAAESPTIRIGYGMAR